MSVVQGTLLDLAEEPTPGVLGSDVERAILGDGAWVDLRRGWMGGAALLFDRLLDEVPWKAERRTMYDRVVDVPRLVCFYGEGAALPVAALDRARRALDEHYKGELGEPFCTVGLCLSYAMGATVSLGTVTRSGGVQPRTPLWRSSRSGHAAGF